MKLFVMDILDGTVVDGPGFRIAVYAAGCPHHCPHCHNPQSWEITNGREMNLEEVFTQIKNSPWNVTFSGGDPFFQAEGFAALARMIKTQTGKTIWCYTGYTHEELLSGGIPHSKELLTQLDVLVDGPFIQELRDTSLRFRGSSNQNIIHLKEEALSD